MKKIDRVTQLTLSSGNYRIAIHKQEENDAYFLNLEGEVIRSSHHSKKDWVPGGKSFLINFLLELVYEQ